jgi:flagellin
MALSIATNTGALMAAASATSVNKDMETSMERLSTGKRINSASDDAAGVAIASRLTSEVRGTNQAIRNAQDGQALINTAEGAHKEVENILQRMREVAVQAANDTNNTTDRTNLQSEMDQLTNEINRISSVTTWAGQNLLTGSGGDGTGSFGFQIGGATNAGDKLTVKIGAMDATTLGVAGKDPATTSLFFNNAATPVATAGTGNYATTSDITDTITIADAADSLSTLTVLGTVITRGAADGVIGDKGIRGEAEALATLINENVALRGLGIIAVANATVDGQVKLTQGGNSVATNAASQTAIKNIDSAIQKVNAQRANLGAISNRLDNTVSNLTNVSINLEGGRGRIEDADFAAESTSLARSQILQQASTAMLAQANASKQNVLSLLQG